METVARNAGQALGTAQAAPRRRPDRAQPGAGGDRRRARAGRGAAAHRVLRHLADPGHRRGREHGGLRGRGRPQERVPAVHHQGRDRRRLGDRRGDAAPVPPAARRATERDRPRRTAGRASSPTRRSWSWSTAARRRSTPRPRCWPTLGVTDVAVCGLAKRLEEVWLPDDPIPGDPAAHLRGALPAAAGTRRGAPLRDHLPPAAAVRADDRVGSGQRAGPRRDPAQGAAAPVRLAQAACRGQSGGDRRGARHRQAHGRDGV